MTRHWYWVAGGLLGLAGCGGDGGAEASGGGVERYCAISQKLDTASDALINDETAPEEEVSQGFATLFRNYGQDLEDLVEEAPAEIKADVAQGVEAFRKAAEGDFSALRSFDGTRVSDFDAKHCT